MELKQSNFIPEEDYKKIVENVPICCVDLVVVKDGRALLVHRKQEPLKGEWCVPGGRVYKNEKLEDAVKRKAKEELGIEVKIIRKLIPYEYFNMKTSTNANGGIHNIGIAFLVKPEDGNEIKLDETSSEYKWIDKIEKDLNPFSREILESVGIFENEVDKK